VRWLRKEGAKDNANVSLKSFKAEAMWLTAWVQTVIVQGTLTEGEGSVQLTSFLR